MDNLKNLRKILSSLNKTYSENPLFESLIKKTTNSLKKFGKLMEKQKMTIKVEENKKEDLIVKTLTDSQLKKKLKEFRLLANKKTCVDVKGVKALKYEKILLLADISMLEGTIEDSEKKIEVMQSRIKPLDLLLTSIKKIKREIKKRKNNNL